VVILYRTNSQSRAIEEACRRHALPYRLVGSVRFYDRREIRDLMAYLRLIANPSDDEAFRRAIAAPRRGVGDTTVEFLAERARQLGIPLLNAATDPSIVADLRPAARTALAGFAGMIAGFRDRVNDLAVNELLRELISDIGYADYLRTEGEEIARERLSNVEELINGATESVVEAEGEVSLTALDSFLQRAALVADVDALAGTDGDALTMMTMHNAKGLEFPIVFVTGLEDGLFPLARAYEDPDLLEEERRLFYVAITRAERTLFLSYAEERRRNGITERSGPSSFLAAIPKGMLDEKATIKVRGSGRAVMSSMMRSSSSWGNRRSTVIDDDDSFERVPAAQRRAGTPVRRREAEDESQLDARYNVGARVRHRSLGAGTVAEVVGTGKQAKVRIDFDNDDIGRRTLVIAQAHLESEID
jgi:DNA helicase-2/ATP-dependent DNA helicase PcrA